MTQPCREGLRLAEPRADIDQGELAVVFQGEGRETLAADFGQQRSTVLDVAIGFSFLESLSLIHI